MNHITSAAFTWPSILQRKTHPAETSFLWDSSVYFFGLGIPLLLILALIDPSEVNSEPRWIKPLKFFISIAVYNLTLEWIYRIFQTDETISLFNKARWTIATGLLIEGILITIQASRGVQSHFNNNSILDTIIFGIMGISITIVVVTALLSGYLIWKERWRAPKMVVEAILLGMLIMTVGSFQGFSMTAATAEQQVLIDQGEEFLTKGSHFVGNPPAANHRRIPFAGWSLEIGDLRIAHFIGMHAIHFMMLLMFALHYFKIESDLLIVRSSAVLYGGFFIYALLQARAGLFLL